MAELLGDKTLLRKKARVPADNSLSEEQNDYDTVIASEILEGKVVCLFFSASWCAPCQHFVPLLKDVYSELQHRGSPLEVIFLSFDKTEEEMMKYYLEKQGDWLAVKFGDPVKQELSERYGISVIPKLIVIQADGEVITYKGRKDVQDKGLVCMRTWQAGLAKHTHTDKVDTNDNINNTESNESVTDQL